MTSRDEHASYYDLALPDGTRTEVWSVLRAVLTPEEALGYAKACLLTRIMRDGKKLDVDRMREAEKVGIEAGMLREAMDAYLAAPGPAAPNAVGVGGPTKAADEAAMMTATEAAQRFTDDAWKERLTRIRPNGYLQWVPDNARIAELEEELERVKAALPKRLFDPVELFPERVESLAEECQGLKETLRLVEMALPKGAGLYEDHSRIHEQVASVVADLGVARNRIAELEHKLAAQQMSYESQQIDNLDRIAELERERDEAREEIFVENERHALTVQESNRWRQTAERAQADLAALRTTLETERQAAVATAEELESRRAVMEAAVMELPSDVLQDDERTLAERVRDLRRLRNQALNDLERTRKKSAELREAYNEAFDFRDEMRRTLFANDDERFPDFLRRVTEELAALRDRYRPRRQSEEAAPEGEVVLVRGCRGKSWSACWGENVADSAFWTHQPPVPGEGEA